MQTILEQIYTLDDKVIIIGGGPSFKEIDVEKIKDFPIIGVNAAYKLGEWVDILFTGDCRFYEWNRVELEKWPNRIITCCSTLKDHPRIEFLKPLRTQTINIDKKDSISWPCQTGGANSGAAAICLAAKLGAKNIFLLGFDGGAVKGKHHWHNYHKVATRDCVYPRFNEFFKIVAKDALKCRINVYNVNPNSLIPYFKKITVEEFYRMLKG